MFFNHKVSTQNTQFFTLKLDTYQNKTDKNAHNSKVVTLGCGCGTALSLSEEWHHADAVGMRSEAQAEESAEFLSCLQYTELLPVITTATQELRCFLKRSDQIL